MRLLYGMYIFLNFLFSLTSTIKNIIEMYFTQLITRVARLI